MRLLHAWALDQPLLTVDAIELSTFPELAERFAVRAVPHVQLRGARGDEVFAGALPEPLLLARIAAASGVA